MSETFFIILGWLLGLLAEPVRRSFTKASLNIKFDEKMKKHKREFGNGDIDYRVEVRNDYKAEDKNKKFSFMFKTITAKNCVVLITLLNVDPNDIKVHPNAYIRNKDEYAEIENEYILWDFQYEGKNPHALDIPPKCGSMVTFARYRMINGNDRCWEIPSENVEKPRIYLTSDEIEFLITVYGENSEPATLIKKLKMP